MHNRTDVELLRDYAMTRSEAAFDEIVRRYADVVYSAALRQVGDAEAARDVAQTVFVDLARKAGSIPANSLLIGWLHRGARFAALEQLRKDQRRQQRERQAMELPASVSETPDDWSSVRPVLDEAIASLGQEDRDALLLRYFRNESLSTVGTALGVSEDAAQKRVSRALDRLREFLAGRGITTTAAALSAVLLANSVQSAPAGFAAALAATALAGSPAVATPAAPAAKFLSLTPAKALATTLVLTAGLALLLVKNRNTERELRDARAAIAAQSEDADALQATREQLTALSNELARMQAQARELPRLRGDVARLRRQLTEATVSAVASASAQATNAIEADPAQLTIKARIVSLPPGVPTEFGNAPATLLGEQQFDAFWKSRSDSDDFVVIGESQVTTLSKRQAQLEIIDQIPIANPGAPGGVAQLPVGVIIDLIPEYRADSSTIRLTSIVTLDELISVPSQDGGSPFTFIGGTTSTGPTNVTLNLPPNGGPSFVPVVTSLSNTVAMANGQTLVTQHDLPNGARLNVGIPAVGKIGPRQLVIFLTATVIDSAGNRVTIPNPDPEALFIGVVSNSPTLFQSGP